MKIFITGSKGFIGKELKSSLSSEHEIVDYTQEDGQDILDYNQLKKAMKDCNIVIHLAAIRGPDEDKTFSDYYSINCTGTFNVARVASENGIKRFIYASSTSYYGAERGIMPATPIKESNPVLTQYAKIKDLACRDCDIAYSTSKVIAEQILANYGLTKKFEVILLRLGPTRKREEHRPFGDLKLHLKIENAISAIKLAIENKERLWYEPFTIMDEIENVDISKAKKILGYNPV